MLPRAEGVEARLIIFGSRLLGWDICAPWLAFPTGIVKPVRYVSLTGRAKQDEEAFAISGFSKHQLIAKKPLLPLSSKQQTWGEDIDGQPAGTCDFGLG